jgi:uncharacterized membrane protein YdbT with pleckstrin-like domain
MTADNIRLYSTRKAYLHIYALPLALFTSLELLSKYGINLNTKIYIFAATIAAICIFYSELHRATYWIDINQEKITVEKGLLRKKKLILPRHILTDLHVDQSVIQRLLKFGRLTISSFSEGHRNVHIHINDPHQKADKIHKIVRKEDKNVGTSSSPQVIEGA